MSLQSWEDEDVLALIEWAANESIDAINDGQYTDAEALQRGVAAIIGLSYTVAIGESRSTKWLEFRLSQVSYPIRERRRSGATVERRLVIESLVLLTKFFEGLPDVLTIGEKLVLPEPFDENSVCW
jgi:hypothetical protein